MRIPLPQGDGDAPAPAATVCRIFCFYSFFHTSDSVALPSLYQAAGYKPCNSAKKRLSTTTVRAATNEQLHASRETGPARHKQRYTTQGFLCGVHHLSALPCSTQP